MFNQWFEPRWGVAKTALGVALSAQVMVFLLDHFLHTLGVLGLHGMQTPFYVFTTVGVWLNVLLAAAWLLLGPSRLPPGGGD